MITIEHSILFSIFIPFCLFV